MSTDLEPVYVGKTEDRSTVRKHLQAGGSAQYRSLDGTRTHWSSVNVWLDEDGDLVQSHPTDDARRTCAAPEDVTYYLYRQA